MATETYNLKLKKPDASDKASPAMFNNNFDIIDAQIADLNRYKETIKDCQNKTDALSTNLNALTESTSTILSSANSYTDASVGNIGTILDYINGEVI